MAGKKGNGTDRQVDLLLQTVQRLDNLEKRVEGVEARLVQIEDRLVHIEGRLETMSAQLGETNSTLRLIANTLAQAVQAFGGRFENHESRISALERKAG